MLITITQTRYNEPRAKAHSGMITVRSRPRGHVRITSDFTVLLDVAIEALVLSLREREGVIVNINYDYHRQHILYGFSAGDPKFKLSAAHQTLIHDELRDAIEEIVATLYMEEVAEAKADEAGCMRPAEDEVGASDSLHADLPPIDETVEVVVGGPSLQLM